MKLSFGGTPWEKEWKRLLAAEKRFLDGKRDDSRGLLEKFAENHMPDNVQETLHAAFKKAFGLVQKNGRFVIERAYPRKKREADYEIRAYAEELRGDKKALRAFRKEAAGIRRGNLALSAAEGVGLGILGIGLPDIPLFAGVILKSVYEIAVNYGFSYEEEEEQVFLLKVIGAAVSDRETCIKVNGELDEWIAGERRFSETAEEQAGICAEALSRRLLYMKFIQGIPLAGALGGMSDAVCLKEILAFADLKYQKRFLLKRRKT